MAMLEIMNDNGSVKTALPDPSAMTWEVHDVSGSDAGRTQDTIMHKNRKGQKRTLSLTWNGPTPDEISTILKATNPEYFKLRYHDAMENKKLIKTFYRSDPSAPVKSWIDRENGKIYETLSFEVIER